jgi:hypothetical protein
MWHQSQVVRDEDRRVSVEGRQFERGAATDRVPDSGVVELPMLTKGGYQEWALVMQVSLEALELWDAVEGRARTAPRIGTRWPRSSVAF